MNKSLTKPLIRPLGGRWARVCLTALLTTVVTVGAQGLMCKTLCLRS